MRDAYEAVLKFAAHDPLITAGLALLTLLIVPVGALHVVRLFANLVVLLVQDLKRELRGIGKVLSRLRREFTTWRIEEESEGPHPLPAPRPPAPEPQLGDIELTQGLESRSREHSALPQARS